MAGGWPETVAAASEAVAAYGGHAGRQQQRASDRARWPGTFYMRVRTGLTTERDHLVIRESPATRPCGGGLGLRGITG